MINEIIKLTDVQKFEMFFKEENINQNDVIIRPTYLSICAADQRYYQGKRKKEILQKKLPLTLIHEAVGRVVYDPKGEFKKGENVVMIPNTPKEEDSIIKENYRRSSLFRSSSCDGFMQSNVFMNRERIIPIGNIEEDVAAMLEITSISVNAIENFMEKSHKRREVIGVWGSGNVGYTTSLLLKKYLPDSKIIVIGRNKEKLSYFSFADETIATDEITKDIMVDHAFECCGGLGSEIAIDEIIDHINPQGTISLLGVSEEPVRINTRMVLEKGLTLLGDSRSGYIDFAKSVEFMQDKTIQNYMKNIISEIIDINSINDIYKAFDNDRTNKFKTVMRWNI